MGPAKVILGSSLVVLVLTLFVAAFFILVAFDGSIPSP